MTNTKYQKIVDILQKNSFLDYSLLWDINFEIEEMIKRELGELRFPIDVETLAENLGIFVFEDTLNYSNIKIPTYRFVNYAINENPFIPKDAKIQHIKYECRIEKKSHPDSKRYGMAFGIAQYFLKAKYESYGELALCPTKYCNLIAEQFATLLLLPITVTCEALDTFIKNKRYEWPIETEKWISYLAECSMTLKYTATNGYQLTRSLLATNNDRAQELIDKFPDIFDE